jgi:uncharacterized RDD family membrane protein YckC
MKSKFEPDVDSGGRLPPAERLIDPEAYDASEQLFAASVEENPAHPPFVVEGPQESSGDRNPANNPSQVERQQLATVNSDSKDPLESIVQSNSLQAGLLEPQDSGAWRNEVTARVNNYRARRRPRAPRYPSLQLKFDPPEPSWTANRATIQPGNTTAPGRLAVAMQDTLAVPREDQPTATDGADDLNVGEAGARILEFPRSASSPPVFDELAEPVVSRPRILEVPEVLLPPPALGGILIEPAEESARERRPGFELPLRAASLPRRLLAGAIDGLLVLSAFAGFAYIFFRVTSITPPLQQAMAISVSLAAVFWTSYQYLLLVYTGTTPGLKLAKLQLSRFDGTAVPRKTRRWRVVASVLSGLSLALGYAWCFLDEDRLCWHDRITRTYMAPHPAVPASPVG